MYSGLLFPIWYSPRFIGKRFGARYRICIGANVHIAKVQCAGKGAMSGQGKWRGLFLSQLFLGKGLDLEKCYLCIYHNHIL